MQIDMKFILPFVTPFVLLGLCRAVYWCAGADWSKPGLAALISLIVGVTLGALFVGVLDEGGAKWIVHIGKRGQQ